MKERIIELLRETGREGIEDLIAYMDEYGFFRAPCSTSHHLAKEGGLAEHSYNVLWVAQDLSFLLCNGPENLDKDLRHRCREYYIEHYGTEEQFRQDFFYSS